MPTQSTPTPRSTALTVGAVLLLAAATFATFIAWISFELLCDEACEGRSWELTWQLVVACAALVPAALMTYFTAVGRRRAAAISLVLAVALYAAWGVLVDAATHGWGEGPVPF